MPNLSAFQANMRAGGHVLTGGLAVYKGAIAAAGDITGISFNPTFTLPVSFTTGDETDVFAGARVEVYSSTGAFKGSTRVRYGAAVTSTDIPVRELSYGEMLPIPGDTFVVRREVRMSDKLVAASLDNGGFAPDMIPYTDQGSNPPPVANSGGGGAFKVDAGETYATVPFFGSLSWAVDPDSSGALTYLWVIPTGAGAFASGSSNTDADPVMELNVNKDGWLIELHVTDDDNGKTTIQYIPVIVYNPNDPDNRLIDVVVKSLAGTPEDGWSYSCRVYDAADLDAIPDGSPVFLTVEERINGAAQSYGSPVTGRSHIHQAGYIRRERESEERGDSELTFEIISPLERLSELPGFSKVMILEASPNSWAESTDLTTGRAITQLIQFYTNLNEAGWDFLIHGEYLNYNYPLFFSSKANPRAQIEEFAKATDARFTCDRRGRFEIQPILSLVLQVFRDNFATTLTLTRSDGMQVDIEREHWRPVENCRIRGFVQGTSVAEVSPVFARWLASPGQGNESETVESLIFSNVAQLMTRVGMHGAMRDGWFADQQTGDGHFAPRVTLRLPGSYASAFDFYAEWIRLNFTSRRRGIDLSKFRYTLESVTVTYEGGTAETEIVLQAETAGFPGVDDTPEQNDTGWVTDISNEWDTITFDSSSFDLNTGWNMLTLVNTDGGIYQTSGFTGVPEYIRYEPAVSGSLTGAVQLSTELKRLVLVTTAADGIYTLDNPRTSRALTLRHTFSHAAVWRDVDALIGTDYVVCYSYYGNTVGHTGFWYTVSSDRGATWSAETQVSSHYSTGLNGFPTWWLSSTQPGVALFSAYTSTTTPPPAAFYSTSGTFASPTQVTTPTGFNPNQLGMGIHIPFHNNSGNDVVYYGRYGVSSGVDISQTWRKQSGSAADISPTKGGYKLRPNGRFAISSGLTDRTRMVIAATNDDANPANARRGVFVSASSGDVGTWTDITSEDAAPYIGVAQAGNNPNFIYMWGLNGSIAIAPNFGAGGIIDKRGNIPTDFPSAGTFIKIFGL